MSAVKFLALFAGCAALSWAWLKLCERLSPPDPPDPFVYDWEGAWDE